MCASKRESRVERKADRTCLGLGKQESSGNNKRNEQCERGRNVSEHRVERSEDAKTVSEYKVT